MVSVNEVVEAIVRWTHLFGFLGSLWPYFTYGLRILQLETIERVWHWGSIKQVAQSLVLPD
jgi:hypothetical protein